MPPEPQHSLDDLATLAGLTPRTVRYYIQRGLVDRPDGEKRGAHYAPRHLEQLLQVRRWVDAGLSLERIAELRAGALAEPPPRRIAPGTVEVWSRVTLADGLELQVEPGRASLSPQQMREMVRRVVSAYRDVRTEAPADGAGTAPPSTEETPTDDPA